MILIIGLFDACAETEGHLIQKNIDKETFKCAGIKQSFFKNIGFQLQPGLLTDTISKDKRASKASVKAYTVQDFKFSIRNILL